jgi:hypothetical protein
MFYVRCYVISKIGNVSLKLSRNLSHDGDPYEKVWGDKVGACADVGARGGHVDGPTADEKLRAETEDMWTERDLT